MEPQRGLDVYFRQMLPADKIFLITLAVYLVLTVFMDSSALQTVMLDVAGMAAVVRVAVGAWQYRRRKWVAAALALLSIFNAAMLGHLIARFHHSAWAAVFA